MTDTATAGLPADSLRRFVRWYDNALPRELCDGLVAGFEQSQHLHVRNGAGVRPGLDGSGWTELDIGPLADAAMKGYFLVQIQQYLARYNAEIGLSLPVPPTRLTADLMMKRYMNNGAEQFQPHFDSIGEKADRYLVFLWYLNDVQEGGATRFVDLDIEVQARVGRLLVFPPYWMYQHAGMPPRSNPKYIVSTYLLFDRAPLVPEVRSAPWRS